MIEVFEDRGASDRQNAQAEVAEVVGLVEAEAPTGPGVDGGEATTAPPRRVRDQVSW